MRQCALGLIALLWSLACTAHEVRPAYLELRETMPGEFSVLWKTPMLEDARLALDPVFSGEARPVSAVFGRSARGAAIQTWNLRAPALRGQTLRIAGLESTMTDALVRVEFADGTAWTQRLTPRSPAATIPPGDSPAAVAGVYLKLGVEHILGGIDHLLFVLALLIIARSGWRVVGTATAFTLAHSITLALATLGFVHVPQQPVEAVIALSVAFVAAEIVRGRRGEAGLAARAPWIVALAFGLLHGFGFAGALSEIGLPAGHVPLALLFFNLGVELGQLLFIVVLLGTGWIMRRARWRLAAKFASVLPYFLGTVAMFWVIQRVAGY